MPGAPILDVLIAIEDPGAANLMLELPETLSSLGMATRIVAFGHARGFLEERHVEFDAYPAGTGASTIMDRYRPRLLLAGTSQNPDSPVLALLDEFRRQRVPTVGFVDMAADANLRFSGRTDRPLHHAPSRLLVVDKPTESAFLGLGYPSDRVHVCGHPGYDRVRRRARESAGHDRSLLRMQLLGTDPFPRPLWTFAAEHGGDDPRMRRGPDYTLHGRKGSNRRVDIVLEEVLDARAAISPRPYIALRLHPKNSSDEFASYFPEIDFVSQGGDPFDLIWASDLVLGLSSVLLMEAALAGRPTLSVVPRDWERIWSPSVSEGVTQCISTRAGLRKALRGPHSPRPANIEPDSASRVADVIQTVLSDPA